MRKLTPSNPSESSQGLAKVARDLDMQAGSNDQLMVTPRKVAKNYIGYWNASRTYTNGQAFFYEGTFYEVVNGPVTNVIPPNVSYYAELSGGAASAGTNWSQETVDVSGYTASLVSITRDSSRMVATGPTITLTLGTDGSTWSVTQSSVPNNAVCFGNKFLTVAGGSFVQRSVDGVTWDTGSLGLSGVSEGLSVTWNGSMFVTVGSMVSGAAMIATSPDGVTWTKRTSNFLQALNSVVWNGDIFVAVGNEGRVVTSIDGENWLAQSTVTPNHLNSLIWDGTRFVAVGTSGTVLTSTDGFTWVSRSSGVNSSLNGIATSGSLYVVVGHSGVILTSPDGVRWTSRSSGVSVDLYDVGFSGNKFYAVGLQGTILSSGSGPVAAFSNSIRTPSMEFPVSGATNLDTSLTVHSTGFRTNGNGPDQHVSSNWQVSSSPSFASPAFQSMNDTVNKTSWLIPGSLSPETTYHVRVSFNGLTGTSPYSDYATFTTRSNTVVSTPKLVYPNPWSGAFAELNDIAWSGSAYVAVGVQLAPCVTYSPDGYTWYPTAMQTPTPKCVAWSPVLSLFVVGGQQGLLLTSADGLNWNFRTPAGTGDNAFFVFWDGARFICGGSKASGTSGFISVSTDGINWSYTKSDFTVYPQQIAYSGTKYLVSYSTSGLLSSTDLINWTDNPSFSSAIGLTWTGSSFVAVGSFGYIRMSPDGVTWTDSITPEDAHYSLFSVSSNGNTLVAVGYEFNTQYYQTRYYDLVYTSFDGGTTWIKRSSAGDYDYTRCTRVRFLNGKFVVLGQDGSIRQSINGANLPQPGDDSHVPSTGPFSTTPFALDTGNIGSVIHQDTDWEFSTNSTFLPVVYASYANWVGKIDYSPADTSPLNHSTSYFVRARHRAASGQVSQWSPPVAFRTSEPGVHWKTRNSGTTNAIWATAASPTIAIAVGLSNLILTSTNGITWTPRFPSLPTSDFYAAVWTGSRFLIGGTNGVTATSLDGINWSGVPTPTSNAIFDITVANSVILAVGDNGVILRAINGGLGWVNKTSNVSYPLLGVASDGSQFVAVGAGDSGFTPNILISADSDYWTTSYYGAVVNHVLTTVAFGAGKFIAGGATNDFVMAVSNASNASQWYYTSVPSSEPVRKIFRTSNQFVTVGEFGHISTSPDSAFFEKRTSFTTNDLYSGTEMADGTIIVVGANGTILTSR